MPRLQESLAVGDSTWVVSLFLAGSVSLARRMMAGSSAFPVGLWFSLAFVNQHSLVLFFSTLDAFD